MVHEDQWWQPKEGLAMVLDAWISKTISGGKREKGAILFIVAAGLTVILVFAGLAMDLSVLYNVKTDLQNAMDAAALAGASRLDGTANGINNAVPEAMTVANRYQFNNVPVAVAASDITFSASRDAGYMSQAAAAASPAIIRFVRVESRKTIELAFMKIMPGVGSTRDVAAYAVAGQSGGINVLCNGMLPLSPAPLRIGTGALDVTHYQTGTVYIIRFAGGNDDITVGSGNFLILDFSPLVGGNSGAALVRDLLAGGATGCIGIGDAYCSKPGVSAGPVRQGLNDRFNSDTDTREGIRFTEYHGNGRRKLPLPITSETPPPTFTAIGNGRDCPVYIYDITCFFMQSRIPNGNVDVTGEFIDRCSVGEGKSDSGRPGCGASGLPCETKLVLYR
jgi:Flp pilus assembly protein TadG